MNQNKFLLNLVVFLSAFLLFVSEPLIGRLLLPSLGGAVHVWLICLTFFQAMLLVGYLYAHFVASKIGLWHLCVLLLPFVNLPFSLSIGPDFSGSTFSLILLLLGHFAMPFIVLSTTTVVVQSWMARSHFGKTEEPYTLYAASNAGSLIGLLIYPLVVEPIIGLRIQSLIWVSSYIVLIMLMSVLGYQLRNCQRKELIGAKASSETLKAKPVLSDYAIWLLLSGLPSGLLLGITNFISMELGSFPMSWVLPLICYLSSFVVTFRTGVTVPRLLKVVWPEILLMATAFYFVGSDRLYTVLACLIIYFLVCILAHGKLYETRPHPEWLTNFYVSIAVGGFLGGVCVSLIAPLLFKGYLEYLIFIFSLGIVFFWLSQESLKGFFQKTALPMIFGRLALAAIIIILLGIGTSRSFHEGVRFRHRNFYGIYRIVDDPSFDKNLGGIRMLVHGKTLHGGQMLDPSLKMMPVLYYSEGGGFADVWKATAKPIRAAVIGLGAGVIGAYGDERDKITFFEIDPDGYELARTWFTYLRYSKADVKIVAGDGRLSIKQKIDNGTKYNLIIIDAFSGSGIPIHLLTKEAIEVYLKGLAEDGIILFHISNDFYNLRPVIKSTSAALKLSGSMNPFKTKEMLKKYENVSNCVAVTRNPMTLRALIDRGWTLFSEKDGLPKVKPWTDDYVNIFSPLIIVK